MIDEKMIEEMAQLISDSCTIRKVYVNKHYPDRQKDMYYSLAEELLKHYQPKLPENVVVTTREMYDELYKKAKLYEYQKENAVVLTREEYTALINEFNALQQKYDDICDRYRLCKNENETIKQHAVMVRKETARDFAERVKERIRFLKTLFHATGEGEYDGIELNEIDELAKQYGVEIEE